ncbi:MAG: hypothetical protein IJY25_03095 [Bacilli bacterium]|nr:hypothetical protein [Bacilli bacterium]
MEINHIPFYIYWETYINFITTNFPTLVLTDDALFLGFIILNCFFIFCIYLIIKIVKFVVLLGKNMIFR